MNISIVTVLIVQFILICIFVYMLYIYFSSLYTLKLEKRFSNYTIKCNKCHKTPFFDKVFILLFKIINHISSKLNKIEIIKRYSERYNKYIDNNSKYIKNPVDFITIKFLISLVFAILYTFSSILRLNFSLIILLSLFIIFFFIIDILYSISFKIKRRQIENDLLSAIIIMNNAFKSGMNITEAVNIVKIELEGPIKNEFIKISNDIKYGLSLEVVFDRFYDRVKIEDIKYISSCLSLINKTGGNIVRVFSSIESNFYDKKRIKNELNSLTSSSKFMFKLLLFLPIVLILIILVLNKDYFMPLFNNAMGRIILLFILILYIFYIIVVNLVMKVKYYE